MQKGFILLFISFLLGTNLSAQQMAVATSDTGSEKGISWNPPRIDFGDIPQNVPASAEFVMTNNTDQSIIITDVKTSCGCTAAKHEDAPVSPGKSTTITATYNAKQAGPFIKSITVKTSYGEPQKIQLKGNVVKKNN